MLQFAVLFQHFALSFYQRGKNRAGARWDGAVGEGAEC